MSQRVDETRKAIELLREKGPRTPKEIIEHAAGEYNETSRRRIYRYLKELEEWGLVEKKEDKYYWYEHVRSFDDVGAYERSLRHSKKIMEEVGGEANGVHCFEYSPLRDHVQTGYPEAYEKIQSAETLQKEVEDIRKRLESAVADKIRENRLHPVKGISGESLFSSVQREVEGVYLDAIMDILLYEDPKQIEQNLTSIRGGCYDADGRRQTFSSVTEYIDAVDPNTVEEVWTRSEITKKRLSLGIQPCEIQKVLEGIHGSKEIKEVWRSCREKQERLLEKESELDRWFFRTRRKVEHGTPLEGSCPICPRIRITPQGRQP